MKRIFAALLIFVLVIPLLGQTPDPGRTPRWERLMDYVRNGEFTFTYKTFTSATLTTPTITGLVTHTNTSAATSGTIRSYSLAQTHTGDGTAILEALRVSISSAVQTGSWANAIVATVDYSGATGDAGGGLAAALCAEITLPAISSPAGSYFAADFEFNAQEDYVANTGSGFNVAFLRFGLYGNGTAVASFEDESYFMHVATDFTDASGNMWYDNTLRIQIETTDWYISLSDAEGEYSSAYQIDISNATDASNTTTGSIQTDGGVGIAKKLYVGTDLAVDGVSNLDNTDIDGTFTMDGTAFDVNSTTTVTIDNTNTGNGVVINAVTSGSPISIGNATSETTINDNFNVTGTSNFDGDFTVGPASGNWTLYIDDEASDIYIGGQTVIGGAETGGDTWIDAQDGNTTDGDVYIGYNHGIAYLGYPGRLTHVIGTFEVDQAATFTGNLDINAYIDLDVATDVAGGVTGIYSYPYHTTNALTGELIAVRGSARVDAIDSPVGSVIGGKFQAGNMGVGTDLAGARGVYAEVVNKIPSGATTWDVARGFEVSMDLNQGSSGNVNTVTLAQAFYACFNAPTSGAYATITTGYGVHIRNEAVGGTGQMLDAGFFLDDRSMSGGISGWDYGLDFNDIGVSGFGTADIRFQDGTILVSGYDGTPNGALTAAKGSLCIDTTNADLYINTNGTTGWSALKN